MHDSCSQFLSVLLTRKIDTEAQRWFATLECGFDVVVHAADPILRAAVRNCLEGNRKGLKVGPLEVQFIGDEENNFKIAAAPIHSSAKNSASSTKLRKLTVCAQAIPAGTAAVPFTLPSAEDLLPSPAAMTAQFLETSGLERYIDVFDGHKMVLLRKILENHGPEVFFDAVVQVAFIAGYRGQDEAAMEYLGKLASEQGRRRTDNQTERASKGQALTESSSDLSALFDRLIELQEPHDVFKAALAYYVFQKRKITQTEASRILKVSRSTLQAHLQLAERLKVADYFV
jgi:hypothetical protein